MCHSFASYQSSLSYQLLGMSCCFHVQNSKLLKLPGLLVTRVLNMCNSCVGYQGSLSYQLLGIFFCFHVQNNEVTWITSYQGHQNMQDFRGLPKFLKLPITGAPLLLTFKAHHESWQAHKLPRLPVPRGPQNAHDFHRLPKFPKLLITGASIFSLDHQPSRLSSNLPGLPVTRGPQNAQNFHRLPRFPKLLITKAFMFALNHQPSRQSSSHLDYQFPRGLKMHKIFIGYQSSQSYSLLSRLFLLSCSKC